MINIKDAVRGLIELYSTKDPYKLCKELEIEIIYSDLGDEINGFFQRTPDGREIVHINSRLSDEEQKYICVHELGHAILHTFMTVGFFVENKLQVKNKYEIQADKFAAELLIEDNLDFVELEGFSIDQISGVLCVPNKLMKLKFNLDA